jgi:hypothetical protein
MKILLLDMDGVLLEPRGYHRALQDTVAIIGRILGYRGVHLSSQDIAAFEAAGVSNEWDSSAICTALLLDRLWPEYPVLTLPSTLAPPLFPVHNIPPPDFEAFIRTLSQAHLIEMPPLSRAEHLFHDLDSRTNDQRQAIQDVLRHAHEIDNSLTHRLFQESVLGSRTFGETYGLAPALNTGSYLLEHDRSTLSEQDKAELSNWLRTPGHRAVIFTNRPSRSVGGHFCSPEAEMGAQGIGLSFLPILGLGGLIWLAAQRKLDVAAFHKPAPVHALAALRLAVGDSLEAAVQAAAALALDGRTDRRWSALNGAKVYVFEDTAGGLVSIRKAREILARIQVTVEVQLYGITDSALKRQALQSVGATVSSALAGTLRGVMRV